MKKNTRTLLTLAILPGLYMSLSSCGGGAGFTNDGTGGGQVGAEYNIVVSYPSDEAITKLENEAGGVYSMSGTILVTDRNGNPPPKGTIVHLDAIDTIKATGNLDTISGAVLTDANPTLADGTATTFTTASVDRDGSAKSIQENDLVLLTNNADQADKYRVVSTVLANSITMRSDYSQSYPTTIYAAGTTSYVIGSSDIGVKVHGIDPDNDDNLGAFTKTDVSGIGKFRLEYPANIDTIYVGCAGIPAIDTRYDVTNSADVYVIARLSGNAVATVDTQGCFFAVAPRTITITPPDISGTTTVSVTVEDAHNVGLPFVTFNPTAVITTDTGVAVTVTPAACSTLVGGVASCTITIGGTADTGDAADIYFTDTDTVTFTAP